MKYFPNPKKIWKAINARWLQSPVLFKRLKWYLPKNDRHWLEARGAYESWQDVNQWTLAHDIDLEAFSKSIIKVGTKISVLMPVFRPPISLLQEAIQSVIDQRYENWELIIVDDGSADENLKKCIDGILEIDGRVKFHRHSSNKGISEATNTAFQNSEGDLIVFMDQDDLISRDCLSELIIFLAENPDCDLLYSDSDKVDPHGRRVSPAFKPDWSPVLLLSYMYFGHVVAVRRALFEQVGGLDSAFDGSQDYDFALKAAEAARSVGHLPKILYHWRMSPGSTAVSGAAKSASIEAGRSAVVAALTRRGIDADAAQPDWAVKANLGLFELVFRGGGPKVSLVLALPSDASEKATDWIRQLLSSSYQNIEILIVHRSEADAQALSERLDEWLGGEDVRKIKHVIEEGSTLAERYNAGVAQAAGSFCLFLSGEYRPSADTWLDQLLGYCGLEGVGAVGPRLVSGDDHVMSAGWLQPRAGSSIFPSFAGQLSHKLGYLYLARVAHECMGVSAEGLAIRRDMFDEIGGFSPDLDDIVSIGLQISSALRAIGKTIICCAGTDLQAVTRVDRLGVHPRLRGQDPYANVNLGPDALSVPVPYAPPLRGSDPIDVVFVSHNLEHEGAPITLLDLVLGLAKAGRIRPTILTPRDGPLAATYRQHGIAVEMFDLPRRKEGVLRFEQCRAQIEAVLERIGAQVVVANTLEMFIAVAAAAHSGVAPLWCHHESGRWRAYVRRRSSAVRARAYSAFAQAYRVVFVAEATRKAWLPVQLRQNFEVVRYAIPQERLDADLARWTRSGARERLELQQRDVGILLLGSVCSRKGQIDLVKAVAGLPKEQLEKSRIFIVGAFVQERYRRRLERVLAKLPVAVRNRITVTGAVDDTSLYYRAADLFICCSRAESAPRVLLEAMSFGLPIITTAVDGIPELVVEGQTALFYRPGDVDALQALLQQLLNSPEEGARLGRNGIKRLRVINNYEEMIETFTGLIGQAARTSNAAWLALPASS